MELKASYSYGEVSKPTTRRSIMDLEALLKQQPDCLTAEEAEEEFVEHYFAPHMYARKMFIPKGLCVVGKIHKHAHLNMLVQGRVKVVTEFGDDFIEAPKMWTSEPGTKRALVALEDLIWVTIHHDPFGDEDTQRLEQHNIAESFESFDAFTRSLEKLV